MICRQACSTSYTPAPRRALAPRPRRAFAASRSVAPNKAEGQPHPDPSQPLYPGYQEEREVSHEAFMHAFEAARPKAMSIPGMQEFAASIWNRRRSIPSTRASDPLDQIFTEFDTDNDGKLTAAEVARALVSRGVAATEEQVQMFIEASDTDKDHVISRNEFASFVFHMASADLRSVSSFAASPLGGGGAAGQPTLILPPKPAGME